MADTARPLGSLQALLADNSSKGISPQDVRDFLVSTMLKQVTTTAADYSATSNDVGIIVDATTNAAVITLPTVSSQYTGHIYFVKAVNAGTNKPYITAGSNINRVSATWTLNSSNEYVTLLNTGSEYQVVGTNRYPIMVQTAPAEYTATSFNEATLCSQTIVMKYGGVCEVDYFGTLFQATSSAAIVSEYVYLKIDNTAKCHCRIGSQLFTTTAQLQNAPYALKAYLTLAAGTHSITATHLGITNPQYPIVFRYQYLSYKLYDLG